MWLASQAGEVEFRKTLLYVVEYPDVAMNKRGNVTTFIIFLCIGVNNCHLFPCTSSYSYT